MALFSTVRDFRRPYTELEARGYDRVVAPAVARFDALLLERYLPHVPRGGHLAEIGCGGGQLLRKLAELRPDLSLTGLDLSEGQVARARRRTAPFGHRVEVVQGSALELPFEDGTFDAVFSVASVKHWPDPVRGLRECARVLRPDAPLLVVEADRGCRPEDVEAFVGEWRVPPPLRPVMRVVFRILVADRSPDLDDARGWLDRVDLGDRRVERIPGAPGLLMEGWKRPRGG